MWLLLLLESDSGSTSRDRERWPRGFPRQREAFTFRRGVPYSSVAAPTQAHSGPGERRVSLCTPGTTAVFHSCSEEGGSFYPLSYPEVALQAVTLGSIQDLGHSQSLGAVPATQPCPGEDCSPRPLALLSVSGPDEEPRTRGWGDTGARKPRCPCSGRSDFPAWVDDETHT